LVQVQYHWHQQDQRIHNINNSSASDIEMVRIDSTEPDSVRPGQQGQPPPAFDASSLPLLPPPQFPANYGAPRYSTNGDQPSSFGVRDAPCMLVRFCCIFQS
jgi:hypothetical protein